MNGSTLQKTAADCAEELPGARLEHPSAPAGRSSRSAAKVFMRMTEVPGRPVVILKADSGEALALRDRIATSLLATT
jgi:predicted DNA-binding protein (MmcQ/YjbR family)